MGSILSFTTRRETVFMFKKQLQQDLFDEEEHAPKNFPGKIQGNTTFLAGIRFLMFKEEKK
jgi:hypothetical protein